MKQITVIGAGLMGSQIAACSIVAGFEVQLYDVSKEQLVSGQQSIAQQLKKLVKKNLLTEEQIQLAIGRLQLQTELALAVKKADLIIEAIIEDVTIKRQLFTQLDQLAPPNAILASNSSMIVSSLLAEVTNRPSQVCNIHFFNPVFVMDVVEIVKGDHTSEDTLDKALAYVQQLSKTPLVLQKEIPGFIANRILGKIMEEAMFLLEEGIATVEEIDLACTKALNHPIGPFALMDLTGLDTAYAIQKTRSQLDHSTLEPSPLLKKKLAKGHLGRKTGQGFYSYF